MTAIVILSALFAFGSVLFTLQQNRLFIETDSAGYMSIAQSLTRGRGFALYDGQWCADWPPLLPFTIALLTPVLRDPVRAFGLIAALSYGSTLLLAGRWMQRRLTWPVTLAGLLLLLVGLPLRQMMNAAFSEPPFIALTTGFLVACDDFRTSRHPRALALMTLFASLSCLVRYTGIVTVGLGLLGLLVLAWRERGHPKWQGKIAIFLAGTLGPVGVWCCLNRLHTGTFTGDRGQPVENLPQIVGHVVEVITGWAGHPLALLLAMLLMLIGLMALVRWRRERLGAAQLFLFYGAAYLILLVVSACRAEFDPLDTRLLSPIYVPLVLAFVSLADGCLALPMPVVRKGLLSGTLFVLLASFCWHDARCSSDRVDIPFDLPHRPIIAYLHAHAHTFVLSNDPARVWYGSWLPSASITGIHLSDDEAAIRATLKETPPETLVVWFTDPDDEAADRVKEWLTTIAPLEPVETFPEGIIFKHR